MNKRTDSGAFSSWRLVLCLKLCVCACVCVLSLCTGQEEPKNMGAYAYVMPRMETCMRALGMTVDQPLPYVGRSSSAVPATGFACLHKEEEHAVLEDAMAL
mmetsp:Transcript_22540/g.47477  ORF Transcript_22540/g.47477 Transcript_22540/m.47477 type:complete len:101 (+) Transcript_22540:646-948(+)